MKDTEKNAITMITKKMAKFSRNFLLDLSPQSKEYYITYEVVVKDNETVSTRQKNSPSVTFSFVSVIIFTLSSLSFLFLQIFHKCVLIPGIVDTIVYKKKKRLERFFPCQSSATTEVTIHPTSSQHTRREREKSERV